MKFATIQIDGKDRAAVMVGDRYLDLSATADALGAPSVPDSVMGILELGDTGVDAARQLAELADSRMDDVEEAGAIHDASKVTFRPPIPNPRFILSVGMNYAAHLEEMNTPIPEEPAAFLKTPHSLTGHNQPIILPKGHADMVDYEGELTFVIGRDCYQVAEAEAMNFVAGYTIANDVSARDWVPGVFEAEGNLPAIHAWEKNILGKQYPTFTPMGPVIATRDEIDDPSQLHLVTRLDGEIMQDTMTDLVFPIPRLIAHYSQWYRFRAGDVVTTGSPSGVGFGRDPKVFMKPGQRIEVTIDGIGTLANPIALEE